MRENFECIANVALRKNMAKNKMGLINKMATKIQNHH